MEEELRARLLDQMTCPVDWGLSPQGSALPRVVLTLVSDVPAYTLAGPSDVAVARVQIDCYAATQSAAIAVARQAALALSGYRAPPLLGIFLDGGLDLPPDMSAGETQARRMLTAMVHHRPA